MNVQRVIRKAKSCSHFFKGEAKISYAQFGEDILVDYFFQHYLKNPNPTYLDIGTNHPVNGNNTYLFYLRNCFGVCIEPDPVLYKEILSKRSKANVLNAGVGIGKETEGTLYTFPEPYTGWNTFSKEEAINRQKETGINYAESAKIPFLSINDVIEKYFKPCPDFVSIDVEGLDFAILQTLDFNRFKPAVFCVETMSFSVSNNAEKCSDIIGLLSAKGYLSYADTHINTIFVRKDILNQ
jgi:FkbM family methyltransferase